MGHFSLIALIFLVAGLASAAPKAQPETAVQLSLEKVKAEAAVKPAKGRVSIAPGMNLSSDEGTKVALDLKYEHYVTPVVTVGGKTFFNNVTAYEQYGIGPSATIYPLSVESFYTLLSQEIVYAHYSGSRRENKPAVGDDVDDVVGRTYAGVGYHGIEGVVGYSYPIDQTELRDDRGFAAIMFSLPIR